MLWSETPGAFVVDFINDGLVVKTKSSRLDAIFSICLFMSLYNVKII